jgi:type II secretory pathway pseudopilin PulG
MRRRTSGFTILELMIALVIVMLVLAAATTFFIGTVRQYKIQTKIVETNIEGVLGLELLRQDLESLGFGVPWDNVPGTVTQDKSTAPLFNAFSGGPMAVVSLDNPTSGTVTVNASDYLVIRSTRVGTGTAAGKWTTLQAGGGTRNWGSAEEDLDPNDRVIVISPTLNHRTLVTPETGILFSAVAGYAPKDNLTVTNIVYGVDTASLNFPWNRADYYIDNTSLTVPQRCAPNTGVLVKRVVSQAGTLMPPLPLLDCVADMEVIYGLDADANPSTGLVWDNNISGLTADAIRTQLKEIRVDILAQEGQRDDSYRTPSDNIRVGSPVLWRDFGVSGYRNYRWKVHTIVIKPRSFSN